MCGLLELLVDRHAEALADDGRVLVDRARARAADLADRIDELLGEARGSVEPLRLEPVDLGRVFDRACRELGSRIEEAGRRRPVRPAPRGGRRRVAAGAGLLSAARPRAAQRGRRPTRRSTWRSAAAATTGWSRSHDNGPGISEGEAAQLFASFAPAARAVPTTGDDGAGVGLAVCRRIVERHGGTIWAESFAGRGTSVSFTLPVDPRRAE